MIDRVVTSGTFSIDGEDFAVDNNIWIVGDDAEVFVIDAAHEAGPIIEGVAGRTVKAIIATHGHNDHINVAAEVAEATGAPILIHPDDLMLWEVVNPGRQPDGLLHDGDELSAGGVTLRVLHTPGHSPGGCCFVLESGSAVPLISGVASAVVLSGSGLVMTGASGAAVSTVKVTVVESGPVLPASSVALATTS